MDPVTKDTTRDVHGTPMMLLGARQAVEGDITVAFDDEIGVVTRIRLSAAEAQRIVDQLRHLTNPVRPAANERGREFVVGAATHRSA